MPRAKGGSIPPPRVNIQPGQWGPIATLNQHDVLSGRGGRINNHPGNIAFRTIVEDFKHEYLDPRTRKLEKAHVAARLVAQIRSTNPPGRFLREDPENAGMYVEIGDQKAWKKAGQALREDAPDVRKEIDDHLVTTDKPVKSRPTSLPPPQPPHQQQHQHQQQPPYLQHQHQQHPQQHPHQRPRLPPGIPPSVSYSPTSAPMPLAPPSSSGGGGGHRPDPPEAVGVTGYRQRPLRYRTTAESGRGGRSIAGGRAFPPGRGGGGGGGGRGPPPSPHHNPQQQQHQHPGAHPPPQGGYHHQNYYNHPPPTPPPQAMAQQQPPHAQHYSQPPPPGGPQFQHDKFQQQAPHSGPPQYQQPYQQHPHQYPPNQPPPPQPGYGQQPPQPQFTSQDGKHGKNRKVPMHVPPIIGAVAHGVHNTMESLSGLTNRVVKVGRRTVPNRESTTSEFPPHMSVATDFTMSDISTFGKLTDSTHTTPLDRNDTVGTFDASMKMSNQWNPPLGRSALLGSFDESTGALVPTKAEEDGPREYRDHEVAVSGDDEKPPKGETGGTNGCAPAKQSTNTSSSDENKSFTMSDLMGSGFSLGLSGRTRSFPDLMLSTGALLPPLQTDSDREEKGQTRNSSSSSNRGDGALLRPFHRQSSSESSGNMGGFHPVSRRSITGNNPNNVLNLNDAMSIMSLDSRKSNRSENSSWLENFRSMQSIHSDMNPWEAGASGRNLSRRNNEMINDGTDGSMGSLLSDVTPELNALDLAEPLLPPIDSDHNMNDSHDFMGMRRPDP